MEEAEMVEQREKENYNEVENDKKRDCGGGAG